MNFQAARAPAVRLLGSIVLALLLLGISAWATLALCFFDHLGAHWRSALAAAYAGVSLAALAGLALRRRARLMLLTHLGLSALVLVSWLALAPSNARDWQTEVAVLPYATVEGDRITVHNIRNFDYRSETDFTPAYYDKTFDLRRLDSVDLVAAYWMGPHIAHLFLSFGFAGTDYLAVSIETRKEKGESYSTLGGFFRQYELAYVVADERDVIRVRTNYRRDPPERVHLYRIQVPRDNLRRLFLDYIAKIDALAQHAEFYNTLTTNCTTNIWMHTRVNPGHPPLSWRLLASGHIPQYLYEVGRLDTNVPFAELQRRSRIDARAQAADTAEDFSRRIRALAPEPG